VNQPLFLFILFLKHPEYKEEKGKENENGNEKEKSNQE